MAIALRASSAVEAIPAPGLPETCRTEGRRVVIDQPGGWLQRQVYRCPDGLAGRTIEVRYPIYNPSLTTVIRLELLSGERFAHALDPMEESWTVPGAAVDPVTAWLDGARSALLTGARHVLGHGTHHILTWLKSGMKVTPSNEVEALSGTTGKNNFLSSIGTYKCSYCTASLLICIRSHA